MSVGRALFLSAFLAVLATPASASDRVPLDRATAAELAAIPGVGPELADRIVALRTERGGRLDSVEVLRVVPGMTGDALDALRQRTSGSVRVPIAQARAFSSADEVLRQFDNEPTIQQVQSWANDYAKTSPELVDRWLRQSRAFAALPEVDLEYQLDDGWDKDWLYKSEDGAVDAPDEDVFEAPYSVGADQDRTYEIQLSWNLNELVMSSERIRVISETQDIVKLRDKVLSEVTSLYFERRKLQVDMLLSPKSELRAQVSDQLRLAEMTANLDALTGGRFSAALK